MKVFEALGNKDNRPQKGGWAAGNYTSTCCICGAFFMGDKRAVHCAPCAYDDKITTDNRESMI